MRDLEARYHDELVVIGVHSAKYTTEQNDTHLAAAIRRNQIDHPVINDGYMHLWQQYSVRAWPTLMFVDPESKVIGRHEGEFVLEMLTPVIDDMIAEFDRDGLLNREPLDWLQPVEPPESDLAFPCGIHADGTRLYIADTNHNRIVVTDLNGLVQQVFGSGTRGLDDGPATQATFNRPHGLVSQGGMLYVADTDNHAVRRIDLAGGIVTTVAGTGQQAYQYVSGGPALGTDLTSPWDLAIHDGTLYIAMAGNHQLWAHRLGSDEVRRFAGTGHEGIRDGTLASSWLAQTSGLAMSGDTLVFTDAETSSVRQADLAADRITTLVGTGLFDWGDTDGALDQASIQHPTGVAVDPDSGHIYIADTYNNKIKRIDPNAGTIETWLGDGSPDLLFEPHALSIHNGMLYIADTNNHAIRRADLSTGEMETVTLTWPK